MYLTPSLFDLVTAGSKICSRLVAVITKILISGLLLHKLCIWSSWYKNSFKVLILSEESWALLDLLPPIVSNSSINITVFFSCIACEIVFLSL